jgi:hypothetical protein
LKDLNVFLFDRRWGSLFGDSSDGDGHVGGASWER